MNGIAKLGRFVRGKSVVERCGLCASDLAPVHPHLVQVDIGKLHCACSGCATVMSHPTGKFRRVPERTVSIPDLRLTAEEWQGLGVPVGIAFFVQSTPRAAAVGFYPSPLGPVETTVPSDVWAELLKQNPILRSLEADVEALLVRRKGARSEAFIVPLSEGYKLTALVRKTWRGFTGGEELNGTVEEFFGGLRRAGEGGA